ncbi:MAG TPA: S9 family peptidase [Candidatus Dormibacteraeota bacterium]|nr:S9 family peptidase [Candidatus Dormibacteraeota bacterium]
MVDKSLLTEEKPAFVQPPVARKETNISILHGDRREDDYYWLRDKGNPEVVEYLEAENAYTNVVMKSTDKLQDVLYQEMLARVQQTDLTVPYRENGYIYYLRTEEAKQYPIHCRKKDVPESRDLPEQILLNLNEMAENGKYIALGAFKVSDDGTMLAYTTDNTGFREYTLHVRDLRTGETLPDRVEKVSSVAWAADNRTLLYTVEDSAKRSYRLYRHTLAATSPDTFLYEEKDERFRIHVERSRSRAFLFLTSSSYTASEVRFLPSGYPSGEWKLIAPRETEHEYFADHHGELFFIRTNSAGRNYRLVTAPVVDPRREKWQEVIPHRSSVMLTGVETFAQHLILTEREDALPHIRVIALRGSTLGESHRIDFSEPAYSVSSSQNHQFDSTKFRFGYQSLATPLSLFDYDMNTRERALLKQTPVLGGYEWSQYHSERINVPAADGTRIPVSLVYKKNLRRNGPAPLLLYGYGSYGFSIGASFSSSRISLLDRGFIYALAHIRGGGEMGKAWHDGGRMLNKKHTFTDFIVVAEFLIAHNYTSSSKLVIEGGSAGGLLMGAVANARPDLCKAIVSHVPFVDVLNTMSDASLPLTVAEYEEWGNPSIKTEYTYMKTYCPYTNLEKKGYPAMLVKTSLNDSQVMYWEPAKYVAKLRTLKTDSNILLLKINMSAGHGGFSGRYDHLREIAFDYAFLLWQLRLVTGDGN